MSKSQKPPKDFEDAMSELDRIVADMEEGKTTLEESLAKFERGSFLIEHCRKVLSQAEQKIEMLTTAKDETGGMKDENTDDT
jgi:exodeoxyribonuclease VII small subunit